MMDAGVQNILFWSNLINTMQASKCTILVKPDEIRI
jgi:hypothetical protein